MSTGHEHDDEDIIIEDDRPYRLGVELSEEHRAFFTALPWGHKKVLIRAILDLSIDVFRHDITAMALFLAGATPQARIKFCESLTNILKWKQSNV